MMIEFSDIGLFFFYIFLFNVGAFGTALAIQSIADWVDRRRERCKCR